MKGLYTNGQEKGKQYVRKVEHRRKNHFIYYFESAFAGIGGREPCYLLLRIGVCLCRMEDINAIVVGVPIDQVRWTFGVQVRD